MQGVAVILEHYAIIWHKDVSRITKRIKEKLEYLQQIEKQRRYVQQL